MIMIPITVIGIMIVMIMITAIITIIIIAIAVIMIHRQARMTIPVIVDHQVVMIKKAPEGALIYG